MSVADLLAEIEDGSGKAKYGNIVKVTKAVAQREAKKTAAAAVKKGITVRQPPQTSVVDRAFGAYLAAMANRSSIENSRPNKGLSVIQANPATAIAAGATVTATLTLPTDFTIQFVTCLYEDAQNFLLTQFNVAGFDGVAGPINMGAFCQNFDRTDRPAPLTGRHFTAGQTITMSAINVSANPALFRGLAVWGIDISCNTNKGNPAPSVLSFQNLRQGVSALFGRGLRRR